MALKSELTYDEWEAAGFPSTYHYDYGKHVYVLNSGASEHVSGSALGQFWNDITGKSNTIAQNSAAASMQEDSQAFNAEEAQKQRDFEAQQAQINRDWQENLSNTAYQRSVADLQAAGLNPWLAVGNGASTPSAVSVVGDSASSGTGNPQASNVNMLAAVGSAAAGIGILIRALKTFKK